MCLHLVEFQWIDLNYQFSGYEPVVPAPWAYTRTMQFLYSYL
jgi:hypothetical protein